MLHSKLFRIFLLLIVVLSVVLISGSLYMRMGKRTVEEVQETILPEEVLRKTTDFEHSQLRNGKILFRVIAGSSTMKDGGDNILERVSLWRFNDSGETSDMIEGEEAVYNPIKQEILFTGDVVIRMERGILIYADQVYGDLKTETMIIREGYRMEHDTVLGDGKGLEYRVVTQELRFLHGMNLVMDEVHDRKEIKAHSGSYQMNAGKINLLGSVSVEGRDLDIRGESMKIDLDENGQLSRLISRGEASLNSGRDALFTGDGILLDINNSLLTVEGKNGKKAVFTAGVEQARKISSEIIFCSFHPLAENNWALNEIQADGDVEIGLPVQNIEECRSEHFRGSLKPGGNDQFEKINLSGEVVLMNAGIKDSREILRGQELLLEMDEDGLPERIVAEEDVSVEIFRAGKGGIAERHILTVKDILQVQYVEGVIDRINGREKCRLRSSLHDEENELLSDSMQVDFVAGTPVRIFVKGNVRGRNQHESTVRQTGSEMLEVFYSDGVFSSFEQSGSVVQQESAEGRSFQIHSERSSYDSGTQILRASGGAPFLVITQSGDDGTQKMETRAELISVSRADNRLSAVGSVESIYYLKDDSMVFLASEMESDMAGGVVEYRGNARLLLGENIIMGDKMVLDSDSRNLLVEGGVDSKFVNVGTDGNDEYRITSEKLELDTEGGTASYRDDVVFESPDLGIQAPFLVVYTSGEGLKNISRIEAWGGVTIREEGRVWNGERAEYLKETGRVVVDGK